MRSRKGRESRPPARAVFLCSVCGQVAATVEVVPAQTAFANWEGQTIAGWLIRWGFPGEEKEGLSPEAFETASAAVAAGSPRALCDGDPLWAPFYCPQCDRSYCKAHWIVLEVNDDEAPYWHDYTAGVCPSGHLRKVDD